MITRLICVAVFAAVAASAATLARFPYLQNMRADRVTVVWTTRESGRGVVEYSSDRSFFRRAEARMQEFPTSQTGLAFPYYQFKAEIEPLRPGIEYFYRVTVDGQNLTPPISGNELSLRTPGAGTFSFLALGDSGLGTAEQLQLNARMMQEKPSFVIHAGDIAYEEGTFAQFQAYYFDYYFNMMARVPFFPALGNHEYETNLGAPYLALHELPSDDVPAADRGRYYSFDWGNAHFISLDTNQPLADALERNGGMLRWLERDLQRTRQYWKIVYFHHPPYATGKHEDQPEVFRVREHIVPLLEKYHVQLVIDGHEHSYQRTRPIRGGRVVSPGAGTVYITTGGGGATLFPTKPGPLVERALSMNHYIMAEVRSTNLVIRAVGVDGKDIDSVTIRPLPVWQTEPRTFATGFPRLAPGSALAIQGSNFCGIEERTTSPHGSDVCGITATFNSKPLPLIAVSPSHIESQIPFDARGSGALKITTANGTLETMVTLAEAAPVVLSTGIVHFNGVPVSLAEPAAPGEAISVFATGLGVVDGEIAAGQAAPASPLFSARGPVEVRVAGFSVQPEFAGLAPGLTAVYQINLRLPPSLRTGTYSLQIVSREVASEPVSLPVRDNTRQPEPEPPVDPLPFLVQP